MVVRFKWARGSRPIHLKTLSVSLAGSFHTVYNFRVLSLLHAIFSGDNSLLFFQLGMFLHLLYLAPFQFVVDYVGCFKHCQAGWVVGGFNVLIFND